MRVLRILTLFAAVALSSGTLAQQKGAVQSELNVRVLIAGGKALELQIPFQHALYYPDGRLLFKSETPVRWPLSVSSAGNVVINGTDGGSPKIYIPDGGPGTVMTAGGSSYRGGMLIRVVRGSLQLINVVNLEDYLLSVVPAEMPPSWSLEALKAQAVIARTYAVSKLNPNADFDLCATQQCQVYPGISKESERSSGAVALTRGQIVAWNGKPAQTFFSSDNGGWMASSSEVWGMNLPYLVAQPDPFSKSPKSNWQIKLPWSRASSITSEYAKVGTLSSIVVSSYSNSGRPLELTLTGDRGKAVVKGAEAGGLVKSLGGYSTRVAFGNGPDELVMAGAGYGHGVGLSQYGAQGMANAGYDYLYIMGFYFPKARIGQYVIAGANQNVSVVARAEENTLERLPNIFERFWSGLGSFADWGFQG